MNDRDALTAAVLAEPLADAPRLVFADWLDEQGDPADAARAELIRAQIELARGETDAPGLDRLTARVRGLLAAHAADWVAPLRPEVREYEFRRGFVEYARVRAEVFVTSARRLFALAPLRDVRLNDLGDLAVLAQVPELDRLARLDLSHGLLNTFALDRFLGAAPLAGLAELDASFNPLDAGGSVVATAVRCGWQRLNLRRCQVALSPRSDLPADDGPGRLRELDLSENGIPASGGVALADCRALAGLARLNLAGNFLGVAGVLAVLRSRCLRGLRELDVSANRVGPLNTPEALRLVPASGLRSLRASGNGLGNREVEALAGSGLLPGLSHLDLSNNPLGPGGLRSLLTSGRLRAGAAVDLRRCGLDAEAAGVFLSHLGGLEAIFDARDNPMPAHVRERLRERAGGRVRVDSSNSV